MSTPLDEAAFCAGFVFVSFSFPVLKVEVTEKLQIKYDVK